MILLAILVFIFILGLLIFVHELGHFVMAKRAGMKVDEFGFGFPPRLFGIRRGETIYSVNWIPLGGFVKIVGEDGGNNQDPRAFSNKSFWARFLTLIAGVTMNFVLGWFLLFLGFWIIGTPVEIIPGIDVPGTQVSTEKVTIIMVEQNSPAEHAGFKTGDVILGIDGRTFENYEDMIAYNKSKGGQKVEYKIGRGDEVITRDVTPRANPPEGSGPVGFQPARIGVYKFSLLKALSLSFTTFLDRASGIFLAFGSLVTSLFTSGKLIEGLSGPIGIAVLAKDFTALGLVYLTQFTAVLSINLAVINAFPFPALDGGRILFLIIEKIRGVKSVKWEQIANVVGFVLLISLMVAVTFRDVNKFSEQFKRLFERIF